MDKFLGLNNSLGSILTKTFCARIRKIMPWVGRTNVDSCEYGKDAMVFWKETLNSAPGL